MKSIKKKTVTVSEAAQILTSCKRVALFAHKNPDGDTVGACVGLKLILQKIGVFAEIFCDSEINGKLLRFEEARAIKNKIDGKYDLMVAVDCGDLFRLGNFSGSYSDFDETLTLDHHGGEYFSKYNCVKNYASTCQIVFEVANALRLQIDEVSATYLYMGLCTDTGNFAHNNTDYDSFSMAAQLFKYGADIQKVYQVFFRDVTFAEIKLTARVLSRVRSYYDNQMYLLYVTKSDLDELGLDQSVTSGLVRYAIDIDTAKVGVCIVEYLPNTFKVSMRGKDFSVRNVCNEFGGGGHVLAAGCLINGFLEDVIEKIVRAVGYSI